MQRPTKRELAQHIRGLDLLKQPKREIDAWLQAFGRTAKGDRAEVEERLHREVWKGEYD